MVYRAQSLIDFCKKAIFLKNYDHVLFCLKYCKEMDRIDVITALAKEYEGVDLEDSSLK